MECKSIRSSVTAVLIIEQRVNNTSGLQIHSIMYRFHPSVKWSEGYPDRQQIVSQITQLWKRYGLQERTKFNTPVTSVTQDQQGRWIINNPSNGRFDGVIPAIGSCGEVSPSPSFSSCSSSHIFKAQDTTSAQPGSLQGRDLSLVHARW